MIKMNLEDLGWDSYFEKEFETHKDSNLIPLRITRENRQDYLAHGEGGEVRAEVSGRYRYEAENRGQFPTVGDWVAVSPAQNGGPAIIQALLPRKSAFVRKTAGENTEEQVVAANIDIVFIVCGLDNNFNPRRVERYLSLAWESGAVPVVLLNKADLCAEVSRRQEEIESVAIGVAVHAMSAAGGQGLEMVKSHISGGRTAAFLGSSGVGKSTIINALIGEERLAVGAVREYDSRGRHTTTSRELVFLSGGGLVIDTPGMREIQVWGDEKGLERAFEDIERLAEECRFRDCMHQQEPGCAVQNAIMNGTLDAGRFRSYLKLKKEMHYLSVRQNVKANLMEKKKWKRISILAKKMQKKY
ncbi:putative ribosome biogenesis GTPase RsgA 2 [Candidatus Zixiibacteriota bacterium]|nr:putative ribosome biogenesis GTPase RsgA 2 [candidate division Zixibacteria bacterium]